MSRTGASRSARIGFGERYNSARGGLSRSPRADGAASVDKPATGGPAAAQGFVRSSDALAPHIPRFSSIPEASKAPQGPYRQAPAEFGGDWWFVNPFTGPEPWVRVADLGAVGETSAEVEQPPADFLRIFGPKPAGGKHSLDVFVWQRELDTFGGVGTPDGFTEAQVEAAGEVFDEWGMGEPVFFQSRNGWAVRFPDSQSPDFQPNPDTAIRYPHLIIATFQMRVAREGAAVSTVHPLVPPSLFDAQSSTLNT